MHSIGELLDTVTYPSILEPWQGIGGGERKGLLRDQETLDFRGRETRKLMTEILRQREKHRMQRDHVHEGTQD